MIFSRTVSVDCETTQTMIVDQMNAWDNEDCGTQPGDTTPNGQKCLYKVISNPKIMSVFLKNMLIF